MSLAVFVGPLLTFSCGYTREYIDPFFCGVMNRCLHYWPSEHSSSYKAKAAQYVACFYPHARRARQIGRRCNVHFVTLIRSNHFPLLLVYLFSPVLGDVLPSYCATYCRKLVIDRFGQW